MPWWSSFSRTGVQGSPTLATAEKGRALLARNLAEKLLPFGERTAQASGIALLALAAWTAFA